MRNPFWFAMFLAMTSNLTVSYAQDATTKTPSATEEKSEEGQEEDKAPSDRELAGQIMTLFRTGKVDDAERLYQESLDAHPNSPALANLRAVAYMAMMRANRPAEARVHLQAHTERQLNGAAKSGSTDTFSQALGMLVNLASNQPGESKGEETLNDFAKQASELDEASPAVVSAIDTQRALILAKKGEADKARSLLEPHYEAAKANAEENPEDARAIRSMVSVLKNRKTVEGAVEGGNSEEAQKELSEYLTSAAKSQPEAAGMIFVMENLQQAAMLARSEPEKAEALLSRVKDYRESEGSELSVPAQLDQQVAQMERTIEQTKKMNAMVGQPAPYSSETFDAWVNGDELTSDALKGKVILLDFFAVWCGPCIQTFPHLREWHDEYSDDGLVIIGVSRYHQYGWDAEANRAKREAEIEPEAERDAMGQFAAHHELRHPIAFDPEGALMKEYMVSGIPHVALIDRQGNLKMFRIGSGPQNAKDVEEAIKEALAESAPVSN